MSELAAGAPGTRSKYWHAASGVVLSVLSFALVSYTAGQEPYTAFHCADLVLNFGVGAILVVSFAAWAFASLRDFQRAASRNPLAKVLLCASLLWAAINLFYLGNSIYGYAQDLRNPRFGAWR